MNFAVITGEFVGRDATIIGLFTVISMALVVEIIAVVVIVALMTMAFLFVKLVVAMRRRDRVNEIW